MKAVKISILSLMLIGAVAQGQSTAAATACGDLNAKFEVKASSAGSPGPETEKAVVFIIERDLTARTFATPSTRLGMDGEWLGATSGNSYSFFVVSPGVHHLCADAKFGGVGGGGRAFLHFNAEAGKTYYFEVRNMRVGDAGGSELHDVALEQVDQDEGEYLVLLSAFVSSERKK